MALLIDRPHSQVAKQRFGTNELIAGVENICVVLRKIRKAHLSLGVFD